MKKKLSIAGMLLMVCMLFCISKTTYAASRTITTNKSYDVILGNETKNYTVIVPNSGYFYYTVIPIKYIENGIESSSSSWYLPSTKMKVGYKLYEEQSVYYGRPFTSAAYSFKKGTRVNISLTDTNSSNTYAYYRLKVITKNPENFEKENAAIIIYDVISALSNDNTKLHIIDGGVKYEGKTNFGEFILVQNDNSTLKSLAFKNSDFKIVFK